MHFRIEGKGEKVRFVPVATNTQRLIQRHLEVTKHGEDVEGPLFRSVSNNTRKRRTPLNPTAVYQEIVKRYGKEVGIIVDVHGFCVHSLPATAATNATGARGRHCEGPGVAGARQCLDDEDLR